MHLIESEQGLHAALDAIAGKALIAVDTEAAGFHRYHDRVCLVQLSTRTETWIVDALAVDVAPLGRVLEDARTEIVLHDADYDLRLLRRDHGLRVAWLFDTKIAAQFAGEDSIGLAGLAERLLGVRLDKSHQRADWARRPLSPQQLEYAADDTRHLPQLRDRLAEALDGLGRRSWAEEEFRRAADREPEPLAGEGFWKLRNTSDLRGRQLAVLRAVHEWRDEKARSRDVAPFRVLSNDGVISLARGCPLTKKALAALEGVPGTVRERYGSELLAVVGKAAHSAPETWPKRRRGPGRPPDPALDKRVDRLKAARDAAAQDLGLERGFLMPRQQLEDIARQQPRSVEELRGVADVREWQVEALGSRILDALARDGARRPP